MSDMQTARQCQMAQTAPKQSVSRNGSTAAGLANLDRADVFAVAPADWATRTRIDPAATPTGMIVRTSAITADATMAAVDLLHHSGPGYGGFTLQG